jgi:hypothetical protein
MVDSQGLYLELSADCSVEGEWGEEEDEEEEEEEEEEKEILTYWTFNDAFANTEYTKST